MKPSHRQMIGRAGESLAAAFLENQGYPIVSRNIRTPYGEIDLISRTGETTIFIEVKTRASKSLGPPEISITARKREHMRSAAEYYMQQHPELQNDYRIDVITVQHQADLPSPLIDHFENAIT